MTAKNKSWFLSSLNIASQNKEEELFRIWRLQATMHTQAALKI